MIRKHATATWSGGLKDGKGQISSESGAVESAYGFNRRFGDEKGTNPEELIAAAHAACFAMAMSLNFDEVGVKADKIDARSTVLLDMSGDAPTVTKIHLNVTAQVPGLEPDRFQQIAEKTKDTCPISRLLAAAEITIEATLV